MKVRMRDDLAKLGMTVPAGLSFLNYDDLQEITYLNSTELDGAIEIDTGDDPDSHPFFPVKLRDGRVFYMIGVDLDWEEV
jgi:hypothetical protein